MTALEFPAPNPVSTSPLTWARRVAISLVGALFGLTLAVGIVALLAVQFFGFAVINVRSGSMEPALAKGDLVIIRPVSAADVQRDDIIYFNEPNTGVPFVHRVVGVNEFRTNLEDGDTGELIGSRSTFEIITKGDANRQRDAAVVTGEDLEGRVWFTLPTASIFSADQPYHLFLLAGAGTLFIAWIGWEIATRLRRSDDEEGQQV